MDDKIQVHAQAHTLPVGGCRWSQWMSETRRSCSRMASSWSIASCCWRQGAGGRVYFLSSMVHWVGHQPQWEGLTEVVMSQP